MKEHMSQYERSSSDLITIVVMTLFLLYVAGTPHSWSSLQQCPHDRRAVWSPLTTGMIGEMSPFSVSSVNANRNICIARIRWKRCGVRSSVTDRMRSVFWADEARRSFCALQQVGYSLKWSVPMITHVRSRVEAYGTL